MTHAIDSQPAYYVAEFDLQDPAAFRPYAEKVHGTVAAHGGTYLAQGGETVPLEGAPPRRIVIIRFPDVAAARRWYDSPDYAAIRPWRQQAGETRNFLVAGLA